jgi:hypothetical protein
MAVRACVAASQQRGATHSMQTCRVLDPSDCPRLGHFFKQPTIGLPTACDPLHSHPTIVRATLVCSDLQTRSTLKPNGATFRCNDASVAAVGCSRSAGCAWTTAGSQQWWVTFGDGCTLVRTVVSRRFESHQAIADCTMRMCKPLRCRRRQLHTNLDVQRCHHHRVRRARHRAVRVPANHRPQLHRQ